MHLNTCNIHACLFSIVLTTQSDIYIFFFLTKNIYISVEATKLMQDIGCSQWLKSGTETHLLMKMHNPFQCKYNMLQ